MADRRPPLAGLGVPATGAGWRSGRPCRIDGDRWRIDRLPPHLLGLEGLHADRARAVPPRIIVNSNRYVRAPRPAWRRQITAARGTPDIRRRGRRPQPMDRIIRISSLA